MDHIEASTQQLIKAIQEAEVCVRYKACEQELERFPGLIDRIDELRTASYNLYNHREKDVDLFDAVDDINREFEELRKIPEVNGYLEAELDFCRKLQCLHREIIEAMGIRIPNFE